MKRFILAAASVAALGGGMLAAGMPAASASTTFTATTNLTNRLDSGNNTLGAGIWATDTLTRKITLVDSGHDPNRAGYDTFTASLTDTGTFTTNSNVGNPNGLNATTPITGTVTGSVNGTGSYTAFDAPTGTVDAGLVPATMDGNGVSSSNWPSLFFPKSTNFECPGVALTSFSTEVQPNPFGTGGCGGENTFSYTYKSCSEQWVDANTDNDGNAVGITNTTELATIGGISGKACPTPTPSPTSPSPSPSTTGGTTTTAPPTGGIQTGGGKAGTTSFPWRLPVGGSAALFLLGFVGFAIRRARQAGQES